MEEIYNIQISLKNKYKHLNYEYFIEKTANKYKGLNIDSDKYLYSYMFLTRRRARLFTNDILINSNDKLDAFSYKHDKPRKVYIRRVEDDCKINKLYYKIYKKILKRVKDEFVVNNINEDIIILSFREYHIFSEILKDLCKSKFSEKCEFLKVDLCYENDLLLNDDNL
jgi:hypothetical protein